jgi:hypothetical protein
VPSTVQVILASRIDRLSLEGNPPAEAALS